MDIIKGTVEQVRELWETREQVDLRGEFGTGEFYSRLRSIYYDTDQIVESRMRKSSFVRSAQDGGRLSPKPREDMLGGPELQL